MLYEKSLKLYEKWWKEKECISSRKPDYQYKKYILDNNIQSDVSLIKYNTFMNKLYNDMDVSLYYYLTNKELKIMYDSLADKFGFLSILEAMRINNAKHHKVLRLKKRVESIISYNNSIFLTLTFTNKVLSKTKEKTRREYVTKFLKSLSNNYVANIDYGKRNNREHYHALVQVDFVDHTLWKYGAINFERVSYETTDTRDKLSLYIAKLTNHAIKVTTKRHNLIYPKRRC